jgi:hypothetical protein
VSWILGMVSTHAGSGISAIVDGVSLSACFNLPRGIEVNSVGTIFVADQVNNRIRMIASSGVYYSSHD